MSETLVSRTDLNRVVNAVRDISNAQVELYKHQEMMQDSIGTVAAVQDAARGELRDLRDQFNEFLRTNELAKALQLAQTEIIAVRQELNTEYGHFGDVRRLATGALQALDIGIVSHGTMRQLSEELMLSTPRYWLAPALVAIAAWIRNDPDLARRALGEAVRRDNDKASLFFALVLRRHKRNQATARWLRQYTARQDPAKLSREFTVVLDAVATGAFGPESKPLVLEQLGEWYGQLVADQSIVDRQVDRWGQRLDTMRRPVDPRYRLLPAISPAWPQLKELYEGATVHGMAEEFFRKMFTGPVPQSDDLRRRVDDILTDLVTRYDVEEAPLRHKEASLQSIIDAEGDKAKAAKARQLADPLHDSSVDFLTLLSNAALYAEKAGASLGTQRFAVALAKDWIVQSAGRLEAKNLAAFPASVQFALEGWTGNIDGYTTENQLVTGLAGHIDAETERAVAQVRFTGKPLGAAIVAGLALVLAVVSAFGNAGGFAIFLLVVAAACGGWAAVQARGLPALRAELRAQGEQRRNGAVARLRGGIAELVDLRTGWERELSRAPRFRGYIQQLNSNAQVAAAPGQKRGA